MSAEIIKTSFDGLPIGLFAWKGRRAALAREVGIALGYERDGLRFVNKVTSEWSDELVDGVDRETVRGAELHGLKAALRLHTESVSSQADMVESLADRAPHAVILYATGIRFAALLSRKPRARAFRRWLVDEVLPQIEETGAYLPSRREAGGEAARREDLRAELREELRAELRAELGTQLDDIRIRLGIRRPEKRPRGAYKPRAARSDALTDPLTPRVRAWLETIDPSHAFTMCHVLRGALAIQQPQREVNGLERRVGAILRALGCQHFRPKISGRRPRGWRRSNEGALLLAPGGSTPPADAPPSSPASSPLTSNAAELG